MSADPLAPVSAAAAAPVSAAERRWLLVLFAAVMAFHLWTVSTGWTSRFLPGNEYRQTHTAISALFIQRDDDFSLAYPTPILGRPWSIPYEFPLYQWTVVALSNATGAPLIPCARAVSVGCFYLTLPALWLLLGRLGLPGPRRLLVLAVVLTSPIYIFYARAFLIETMALMFSVWFLHAYVAALERRSRGWLAVAVLAGLGAGLVKVMTFLVHLVPAAVWTAWWLWQARREAGELARRFAWGAATVAIPFLGTLAWIRFADGVKARNLDGLNMASGSMTSYHFGTWADRASAEHWMSHAGTIAEIVANPVALVILAAALVGWAGRGRRLMAGSLAVFALGPLVFPVLYSWHDYYFAANALFLLGALGWGLVALLDSGRTRWLAGAAIALALASQVRVYLRDYHPTQRVQGEGGGGIAALLRDTTEPDDVLIIAGKDWAPIIPFYAGRRALMFRVHKDYDWAYITPALERLREDRAVLLLAGPTRANTRFRDLVIGRFGLGADPVATGDDIELYTTPELRRRIIEQVHSVPYGGVDLSPAATAESADVKSRIIAFADLPERQQRVFAPLVPTPSRVASDFPVDLVDLEGGKVLSAHPNCRIWFDVAPGPRLVEVEFGILPAAYEGVELEQSSDGVDFTVGVQAGGGAMRTVFHRRLDPQRVEGDRGRQRARVELQVEPGEQVVLVTGPGPAGQLTRDWAYWGAWRME